MPLIWHLKPNLTPSFAGMVLLCDTKLTVLISIMFETPELVCGATTFFPGALVYCPESTTLHFTWAAATCGATRRTLRTHEHNPRRIRFMVYGPPFQLREWFISTIFAGSCKSIK
jgi:hypothetical protein